MIVYRLAKSRYIYDLSGKGAELTGGRWNSRGVPMLYTGQSRALCTTEIAVHIPLGILPVDYSLAVIDFPDNGFVEEIPLSYLPVEWKTFPHPHSTQLIGDNFIQGKRALVLKVPSAVIQGDFNFLINPLHPDLVKVKILSVEPFDFNARLFR